MTPAIAIRGLWVIWALSWAAAAWWSKPAANKAGIGRELAYRLVISVGVLLLLWPKSLPYGLNARWWPLSLTSAWAVTVLIALGFVFTWWARLHLGTMWSSNVTRKEGHHIVDTGPYGLVRHPIYTGLLFSMIFTAIAKGTAAGVIGLVFIILGFAMKARLEERFLREELGASEYDAYARRVPMLVPFWPTSP
jgi:protein-S-isoprenylcysteine O-methyltransferase Ste14